MKVAIMSDGSFALEGLDHETLMHLQAGIFDRHNKAKELLGSLIKRPDLFSAEELQELVDYHLEEIKFCNDVINAIVKHHNDLRELFEEDGPPPSKL